MKGNDYNLVLSVFYISYIVFEIPVNILCKWIGPGWFLPITSLAFGLVSIFTAFVNDVPQACGVRFVLGIFEAGMLPGIAYYMSRWYRRAELTFRLSLYLVMAPLAGAFGGLLASAILKLSHFGRFHRWEMIFGKLQGHNYTQELRRSTTQCSWLDIHILTLQCQAIEGIITIGLSLISFCKLAALSFVLVPDETDADSRH